MFSLFSNIISSQFDSDMNPLPPAKGQISQAHTSGIFLEKPGLLKEALKRRAEWTNNVPGYLDLPATVLPPKHALRDGALESLLKLREEKARAEEAASGAVVVDPNDDGRLIITNMANGAPTQTPDGDEGFDEDASEGLGALAPEAELRLNIQKASEASPGVEKMGQSKDPVVVFVRHGRTPHNNLGLFTGWEDPSLAPDGVEDAKNAGRLLKMHGFEFDVVYTSWLTRAIETACECNVTYPLSLSSFPLWSNGMM